MTRPQPTAVTLPGDTSGSQPPTKARAPSLRQSYRTARAHNDGGGLFSDHVIVPIGSLLAAIAIRRSIHPSAITLTGLLIGVIPCVVVILHSDTSHPFWLSGLLAFLFWQLAYTLDCADGPTARVAGKQSEFGARLDVLVDFTVNTAVICTLITLVWRWSSLPTPLLVACTSMWPLSLFTMLLARNDGNVGHSLAHRGRLARVIKLVRDNGAILFVVGGWLFISPRTVAYPVLTLATINALFLIASIAREGQLSMRAPAPSAPTDDIRGGR